VDKVSVEFTWDELDDLLYCLDQQQNELWQYPVYEKLKRALESLERTQ
jgi:predicted component of viral defense system (DUF524 family)